jgi:hypothetical protein
MHYHYPVPNPFTHQNDDQLFCDDPLFIAVTLKSK